MNIENLPARLLTLAATFISGFIVAAWCLPGTSHKPRLETSKPAALIVIPAKDFASPTRLSALKGKTARLIRKNATEAGDSCVINHKAAQVQISDQLVYLEFGLDGLESLVLNVSPADLKTPDIIDSADTGNVKNCSSHPRITYGT